MKNLNLIERLWKTDSHEKQKVRGMQKYCILLLLLFTCITHAYAGEYAGGAVYFDNSVTNWSYTHVYLIIGKDSWSTTYQMEPMTGTSYYHVSLPKGGWSDATYIAVAAKDGSQSEGSWSDVSNKFTKYSTKKTQSGGLSQATYILTPSSSSNGFSFTLSSLTSIFSSCPTDVLNDTKIMVYAGEAWSWDQGFYRFMSTNNTSNTVATAAIRGIKKNLTNIGDVGFGPALLASGTYYQGHWASGLSKSISAGKAYMVYSKDKASDIGTALATSGDNSLYNVTKVNSSPTTSVTTTIGSSSFAEGTSSLSVSTGSVGKSVMNSTNTIEYYLYNGSTWSKVTVSAGSLNVASLEEGSYKLATVLYDGYIYVKADEDNFSVYAVYSITYRDKDDEDYSGDNLALLPTSYNHGTGIASLTAGVKDGYIFNGWFDNSSCTGDPVTSISSSATGDKTFYAKWTEDLASYTVSFDLQGHGSAISDQDVESGGTVEEPSDPSATGYTFGGWYKEAGCTNEWDFDDDKVTEATTLYAKWTAKTYTAADNLDKNGGDSHGKYTATYDATTIAINTTPSRSGYTVEGYYKQAACTNKIASSAGALVASTSYTDGSSHWTNDGNETLYTNWTPNPYTITFNGNKGSRSGTVTNIQAMVTVTYENNNFNISSTPVSSVAIPVLTGYTFGGYYTEIDGAGTQIVAANGAWIVPGSGNGNDYLNDNGKWVKAANTNVYAKWTAKQTTVTLDLQSGSDGDEEVTATFDAAMPSATMPTRTGYEFGGYYTSTGGGGTKYYNADGSSAKNWNFDDATKTLYAKWTAHAYDITYNLDGGTNDAGNPDTYTIESSLITLENPTKTGYDFVGWYTNAGKTISGNTIAAGSTGDKEFWAKWTVHNYNITYDPVSAPSGVTYTTTPANADYNTTVNMVFTPSGDNTVVVTVVDESSNEVTVTNPSSNTYRFTMPASNVTVSVSVLSVPIVYVLKTKSGSAYFPDGFTSAGSASDVKIWAWKPVTGNPNFYDAAWTGPSASSVATEYTDGHGNVWWRFVPENDGFTRTTPFNLILHSGSTKIYASNEADHYVSDGTKRTQCNASTDTTYTGTVWVVPGGTGSKSATLYYENPSSSKKFCFVQGRFKAYTDKSRQTVLYTDPNDGTKWGTNSTNIRMFYDETNSRYYLHTYCTPNELRSISSNNGYIHLTTSTVTSSLTGGSSYYANSSENLTAANTKINFSTTSGSNRPYITSTVTNKYVVLYWDESKLWYEEEPIPAAIDNIGLSVSRVPPMASITATPNMSVKGTVNQAYCWGVYTDAGCTEGNKVDVSFSSVGDGKVQFVAPQEQRTYYLKLIVRSTDACDAAIDDEEVVSFTVTTSQMVFFKKVPNWGNVHFYFLGASYWDNDKGAGCKDRDGGAAHGMTRIGNSDVYYYDYSGNSVMTTYMASNSTAYIAFTDNYKPNSNNFSGCQAAYRGDFSACAPMYVPENHITDYKNTSAGDGQAAYYNRGYWTTYMSENSGFTLHVYDSKTKNSGTQIFYHDMEGTVGNNTYTFTYDFADASQLPPYTYGFEVSGCGGSWYAVDADMDITNSTNWNIYTGTSRRGGIDIVGKLEHTFILTLTGDGHVQLSVEYPLAEGDYRLLYDDETQSPHPSQYVRARANGKDTVSMFIRPSSDEALLKVQKCTDLDPITWEDYAWNSGSAAISIAGTEDGVYNFYLEQDGSSNLTVNTSETKPYSGKYYIRTSGVDGGWTSYKTSSDNLMTYAQYPDDKGYGFNYYKAKWVGSTGTNVTYTIACDYSPSLSDTLVADPGNNPLDTAQSRSLPHSANIRFGWHSKTNHLKREYINGSSNISDRYLVMIGDAKLMNPDGTPLAISGLNANEISFADLNNWIYRCDVKAQEGAAVKLQATYDDHPQYFIGGADKTEEIIGGSGENAYVMRVTYDFKTNRLMTAWLPSGTQVTDSIVLDADMMLIREGQNAATQVFFNGSGKAISDIHTIYGVMEFQYSNIVGKFPNWSSPNAYKYLMYYISFPFDVKVSEIFGCGVRGENWIIQKYNGAKRAKIGWFAETSTFWETMEGNETMNAYEGYLLILDRISFNDPGSSLWFKQGEGNSIYLYFPSTSVASGTISEDETTIHVPEHTCTIDRTFDVGGVGTVSHKNTDSHWNVIGTPLFENDTATSIATPSADGAGATTLQYYYAWNSADNTLAAQAAFDEDVEFKSMHGYMVQYAGDVTFSGAKLTPPPASVAARRIPGDKKNYRIKLRMMNEDGNRSETFVELRENACDTFALNEDMYMMRSSTTVDLYTFAGAYDVAANVLSMNNHIIPVGMDVKRAGTYRFTMPSDFSGTVTLKDTEADVRTNLAYGDYEVNLPKGTSNNRFFLEINIQQMPTAIDGAGGSLKDGKAHKFIENGQMYILQNGIIYDARGNRVR